MAEVNDWKGTKPRSRKGRMRKAILVEPEEIEMDEDSEEKEGRKISQQPVERVISKTRKLPMNQKKAKEPSDENLVLI